MAPEARREQLLDVLADLVLAEGYAAISIDRVAREAGIARTVVYSQFGNLQGLLEALVDRTQRRAVQQVQAILALAGDDVEAADLDALVVTAVRTFGEIVLEDPRTWRLALLPAEGAPKLVQKRTAESRHAIRTILQPVVAWAMAQRGLDGVEDELAARAIVSLGEDAARLMISDPAAYPPERMASFASSLLLALRSD